MIIVTINKYDSDIFSSARNSKYIQDVSYRIGFIYTVDPRDVLTRLILFLGGYYRIPRYRSEKTPVSLRVSKSHDKHQKRII